MAKFLLTKIISMIFLVDLALATSRMLEMTEMPLEGEGTTNGPVVVMVVFHNQMGNGQKIQVHAHGPHADWVREIKDNDTGFVEFMAQPTFEVQAEFRWDHGETSGNLFLYDRDSTRCDRWNCHWMVTPDGVSGLDGTGKSVIFYKWNPGTK